LWILGSYLAPSCLPRISSRFGQLFVLIHSSRIPSKYARILATQIRLLLGSIATGMGANGDEC
jgi:hypothetical protein